MKHIANCYDYRRPDAFSLHKFKSTSRIDRELEWNQHMVWAGKYTIGRPQAAEKYTVEQLEEMGLIGLYL